MEACCFCRSVIAVVIVLSRIHRFSSKMVLYTPGYKFFVVNNMATTLTCNWTDELGNVSSDPGQMYPLILSYTGATGENYSHLSIPPSDQLTVNRSFYSTSYTFTVLRSDHMTKFKCTAFVDSTILEEKRITIFIKSGPARPNLQGQSTVPKGDQGEWTCTSDCATHEFPEVSVSVSNQYDYWDQCPQCLEVTRDVYNDIYGVKTFKVVVKVSGMLPSGEPGDVFYLQCRSVYNPFPASSRTLYSEPFSVNVTTEILHTERIVNTTIDSARNDTQDNDNDTNDNDNDNKDGDDKGVTSSVMFAWTVPLVFLLVVVVAAIYMCGKHLWSSRQMNTFLSEAEIELNPIPSIVDQVEHSQRLEKKDIYTAPVASSAGDQSDSEGNVLVGLLSLNWGRPSDDETTLDNTLSYDEIYATSAHSVPETATVSGLYDAKFLRGAGSYVDPTPFHKNRLSADSDSDPIRRPYQQKTSHDSSLSQSEDTTGGSESDPESQDL